MITFMYIIFLSTILLTVVRILWNRHQQLIYEYKLFELRDKLRNLVLSGVIEKNNKLFDFFDYSLSMNIKNSYYITLYSLLVSIVSFTKNREYDDFQIELNREVESYPQIKQIKEEYNTATANYIFNQHIISLSIFIVPLASFLIGISILQLKFKMWIDKGIIYPEDNKSNIATC